MPVCSALPLGDAFVAPATAEVEQLVETGGQRHGQDHRIDRELVRSLVGDRGAHPNQAALLELDLQVQRQLGALVGRCHLEPTRAADVGAGDGLAVEGDLLDGEPGAPVAAVT